MTTKKSTETPLMRQYSEMKAKYPDALMLYRMGDFYETFGTDAILTAKILGITLTKRSSGNPGAVELAGFPHHALDTYLPKLVRAGQRVAICDQLEDPKKAKNIVKRGVTELITPGMSYNECALDTKTNIFLAAVYRGNSGKDTLGLSLLDLSTGEFLTTEGDKLTIDKLLNSFQPKEVIYPRGKEDAFQSAFGTKFYTYPLEEWFFEYESAKDKILKHFGTSSLKGFGIEHFIQGISTAGAILSYLEQTKHDMISHITSISRIDESNYVLLDRFSLRNLEILQSTHEGGSSLADILDRTVTPMGSRMLRRWIGMPLKSIEEINKRLSITQTLISHETERLDLATLLRNIGDLERLASKIASSRCTPREMVQLQVALSCVPNFKSICANIANQDLTLLVENLEECTALSEKIRVTLRENAPHAVNKGMVINVGVNAELDELRDIRENGKELLLAMQQREIQSTGIPSLKIGFNNVFGYYIEITNVHKDKAPASWIRKQTLTGGERYITPELKEYEDKILGAEDKIIEIETQLFDSLLAEACSFIRKIQLNARILGSLDTLISFAEVSIQNRYSAPIINESGIIDIKGGRHPVIERQLPAGEEYVTNDIFLDNEQQQIIIITGPNMSGKSALLRQTALIVIMAQAGCFVPAVSAEIGYVDKIFTRVGASDNISQGESTFMVEMNEAANILNNISDRSLVLFDELGRGTSTYDGISIAWAIVEYLHENPKRRAKTLFATHYHEMNEMERTFKKIKNYNVSVKELNNQVVFLRKLVPGGSNHSFGIQVGRMAGLPLSVTKRAEEILKQLEKDRNKDVGNKKNIEPIVKEGVQLSFFQLDDPVLMQIRDEIAGLNVNNLTPIEALNKLNDIKKIVGI
ncbi:DNA mismatch repair protein MutS [Bacteroidia bacterium]|nr:DNA mismatch repair protein MutS [Bacteroidia bacterium]